MEPTQLRRKQVFTDPRFDNRLLRRGTTAGPSQRRNPRRFGADAAAALEDEMGIKADSRGQWGSVRDFGRDMMLASQQRNSLSRGTPGGYASTLGTPLNSNTPMRGFAQSLQQRNQTLTPGAPAMTREQRIAQAQQEGTFGTIRDKYNQEGKASGMFMNKFGNIQQLNPLNTAAAAPLPDLLKRPAQSLDPDTPGGASAATGMLTQGLPEFAKGPTTNLSMKQSAPATKPMLGATTPNAPAPAASTTPQALEERAGGLRLLREMSQSPLQVTRSGGDTAVEGKYGSGYATQMGPRREGLIGGRPASEVMQGLANQQVRQGTLRSGDKLPQGMTAEQAKAENEKARQNILSRQRIAAKTR